MDIWAWVNDTIRDLREQGHQRLADIMDAFSEAVCDHQHELVDALYPEALHLTQKVGHPWIELFFRHWYLQSRVLNRLDVAQSLDEANALKQFAETPECAECPQRVCVTQDLVGCWAGIDGPGYAEARLAMSTQTLATIDPQWPCFECISAEGIEALVDAGRPDEALRYAEAQYQTLIDAGQRETALCHARVHALLRLDRGQTALALLDQMDAHEPPGDRPDDLMVLRALVLAHLGKHEEALAVRPAFDLIEGTCSLYPHWAEATVVLARARAIPNDWSLEAELAALQQRLVAQGVIRHAVHIAQWRAELAMTRVRPETAALCCAQLEALLPRLKAPLGADEALDTLREEVNDLLGDLGPASMALPPDPATVVADLARDPELDLPVLEAARQRWPDHEGLALVTASSLDGLSRGAEALGMLEGFILEHPEAGEATAMAFDLRVQHGGLPSALEAGRRWLESMPPEASIDLRMIIAQTTLHGGMLSEAFDQLQALQAQCPEPGPHDVLLLMVATQLGRWSVVREAGRRLGLPLEEGEAPPDRALFEAPCAIFALDHQGVPCIRQAMRTGPATAQIVEMGPGDDPINFGDEVLFDLMSGPEDESAPVLNFMATLEQPYTCVLHLEGHDPGLEGLTDLAQALTALGFVMDPAGPQRHQSGEVDGPLVGGFVYRGAGDLPLDESEIEACLNAFSARWGGTEIRWQLVPRPRLQTDPLQWH
ncbi:MAG: hypothetical protein ACE366_31875 [Bradymonadia bacterium]